ncbi:MAG: hypothetical protein AAF411_04250 [Myxococcota bacterium]
MNELEDEDLPTEEELAEADALANMLEGGTDEGVAEPLQEAAALLRFAADGAALSDDGRAAAKTRIGEKQSGEKQSGEKRRLVAALSGAIAAAAAAAVLLLQTPEVALPSPSLQLLKAQARAARGEDAGALDEALVAHRRQLLGTLQGTRP